jgi:hypothetical protein
MTTKANLTKLYKQNKLKLDENYYIRLKNGKEEIQMYVGGFLCHVDNPVVEVLDVVPSYAKHRANIKHIKYLSHINKILTNKLKNID